MTPPLLTEDQAHALDGFDQDLLAAIDAGDLIERDRLLDHLANVGLPQIAARARVIFGDLDNLDDESAASVVDHHGLTTHTN